MPITSERETAGRAVPTLTEVAKRLKSIEIGSELYIGVEAWPIGAWSVVIPAEGRAIFESWLSDLRLALSRVEVDHG